MNKYIKHFKVITKHKWEVMKACFHAKLYWQGITHDLSKYSLIEFFSSAKYFQGNKSPIDAEKELTGYSIAWQHHKGRNPHHWEYWIDNLYKGGTPIKMPEKYLKEMICDWIGAGKVYNKNNNWTQKEPLNFLNKKIANKEIVLHPETQNKLIEILTNFSNNGYTCFNKQ
jgi:hypothetical protein